MAEGFDVAAWAEAELHMQERRVGELATAFLHMQNNRDDATEQVVLARTIVGAVKEVYGKTDRFSLLWFVKEALAAGVVQPEEVGGITQTEYGHRELVMYLLLSERERGIVLNPTTGEYDQRT